MVRALHAAGIEVILDVVYNHTAEGDQTGPTLSLPRPRQRRPTTGSRRRPRATRDYTGCGNTLDLRHPHVPAAGHGLAALLGARDARRRLPLRPGAGAGPRRSDDVRHAAARSSTVIGQDPVLSQVKLIAEPWDVGPGGYQVGELPAAVGGVERPATATRCATSGAAPQPAAACATSPTGCPARRDLFAADGRRPLRVGQLRHRARRLHPARPGDLRRTSTTRPTARTTATAPTTTARWNCGVEGETDDPEVSALRRRQAAQPAGDAAALDRRADADAGDELGRTQRGNNNAYCQDNEIVVASTGTLDARGSRDLLALRAPCSRCAATHPVLRQRRVLRGPAASTTGGAKDLGLVRPDGARDDRRATWFDHDLRDARHVPRRRRHPTARRRAASGSSTTSFLLLLHAGADDESSSRLPGDAVGDGYRVAAGHQRRAARAPRGRPTTPAGRAPWC